jgi:hypothetical protein
VLSKPKTAYMKKSKAKIWKKYKIGSTPLLLPLNAPFKI